MKRYIRNTSIFAMSMQRPIAIRELNGLSNTLAQHVCKISIYDDTLQCKDHWIHELADYISQANDITVKPKNNKLKLRDYENEFYGVLGETEKDANVFLNSFYRRNLRSKQYPAVAITKEMCKRYIELSQFLINYCKALLSFNNELSLEDIENDIKHRKLPVI